MRIIVAAIIVGIIIGLFFIPFIPVSAIEPACVIPACQKDSISFSEAMINYITLSQSG